MRKNESGRKLSKSKMIFFLMKILIIFLLLFLFLPILIAFLLYIRWKLVYSTFSRLGIKGPKPQLYYGNAKEIIKKGIYKFFKEYDSKYGSVYGYFNGTMPFLVVSDLEMIQQIAIKQFDIFMDRSPKPDLVHSGKASTARGLINGRGQNWRRLRKILSKSFNTINMNRMSPLIEEPCISLFNKIEKLSKTQTSINMFSLFSLYTMEVILLTGFGHKCNIINGGEKDEFVKACNGIFCQGIEGVTPSVTFLSNFPFMEWYVRKKALKSKRCQDYLTVERNVEQLLTKRLQDINNGEKVPQDLLQLLIDARADDSEIDIKSKQLDNIEIVRTSLSLLLAGYENTGNTLSFATYLLTIHPEVQDKLYNEINTYYRNNPNATLHEVSQNITYLDMILQESLRLYPSGARFNRYCTKTVTINGVTIPKGCSVEFPVFLIHHSSEHWEDPEEFKPDRFSKEKKEGRHPLSHIPFGMGPRSCIGMRLALMETKMALVSLVYNYEFIQSPDTEKPLSLYFGVTMIPKNGVWIKVKKRNTSNVYSSCIINFISTSVNK